METMRKNDTEGKSRFRTDRMIKNENLWYFCTREGSIQGPFQNPTEANNQLRKYIQIMSKNLAGDFSMEPCETLA